MSRKKPDPQDERVQLNASIPMRLKDRLDEEAEQGKRSELVTSILLKHFGMD